MLYEYQCDVCEYVWEEFRAVAERDDEAFCPECGMNGKRQVSDCNFHLKGGCWEKDGYSVRIGDMNPKLYKHKRYT